MTNEMKWKLIGFSLLDGIFWGFFAAFYGFAATYLLDCGMSNSFLSMTLSVYMVSAFCGAFFWGGLCDRKKTNRKVFIPEFTAALLIALAVFFTAKISLWLAAGLYILFGFISAPLGSNLDAWMLRSFDNDAATYGQARSIGSAGYAVMALVGGMLISKFGYITMPISFTSCALIVLVLAFIMKEKPYGQKAEHLEVKDEKPGDLVKIAPYRYMIIMLFLTGLAISPINNLKIVLLKSVGGDVGILGVDSFLGVMVQAVFIFISGNLRRIAPWLRMFLMAVCVLLTMVMDFTAQAPFMIIAGTVFANVSYGLMLPTMREITEKTVSPALKNTAHSMSDAMFGSFSGIIALLYSGTLMDAFGARSVALLGLCIMVLPVVMGLLAYLKSLKTHTI